MVAQTNEIMYEVELGADEPDEGLDAPPIRSKLYLVHNFIGLCYHDRYSSYLCPGSAKFSVHLDVRVVQCCHSFCFKGWFRLLLESCGKTQ